jgi:nucleoid DNA-binding protein
VIDQLDLSKLTREYAGRGSKAYHPATLLGILVSGYATGIFSSRRLEQARYDSIAFRFIAAERIEARGFGSFALTYRPPRTGRNPKTGETVPVPAKRVARFTAGKELRERVESST